MVYVPSYPTTGTTGVNVVDSTTQIRTNWDCIEDWWDVDHDTLTEATSGNHLLGRSGIITYDTSANIAAISEPGTGALAYDSNKGELKIYRWDSTNLSAGWERITAQKWSRMRQGFGGQSIAVGGSFVRVITPATIAESYDTLTEYDSTLSPIRWTAKDTGYYLVGVSVGWPQVTDVYSKTVALYVSDTIASEASKRGSQVIEVRVSDILYVTTGQYIDVYVNHNHASAVTIAGGTLFIQRLS